MFDMQKMLSQENTKSTYISSYLGCASDFNISIKYLLQLRIRDPPTFESADSQFQMSFKFRVPDDNHGTTYFAFTYPYMYKELQINLDRVHRRYGNGHRSYDELSTLPETTIYFHRETVVRSLEKRKMDLITLTGMNGLTRDRELNLENLFKEEKGEQRPYKFRGKKTVFISARVHPGETCSSHVINGFLKFLLRENDPRAAALRRKYVFKLIPMLNPDGVVNGHYRCLIVLLLEAKLIYNSLCH